ncbi:MAG TPA: hypothetical protein VF789_14740 [Thermoanaerobaculia bacterium]
MAKTTCDATEILDRLTGDDPELRKMIAEEAMQAQVVRRIHEALTKPRTSEDLGDKPDQSK